MPKTQQELAIERREAAGLPVLRCPNCGEFAAHWEPQSVEAPGRYVCEALADSASTGS
jgi:hypothetical protein